MAPLARRALVRTVAVVPNCVAGVTGSAFLSVVDMAQGAVPLYDPSAPHRLWKEEFGPLLAQKGLGEVERLYHERIELYRKAADATLDNSHGYQAGMYGLQKLITTMFNIYA